MWIVSFAFMIICSFTDIRKKEIPVFVLTAFSMAACIRVALFQWNDCFFIFLSLIPGCLFLIIARMTRESVGYGDGWMILNLGLILGYRICFFVVVAAMLISALAGIALLILKKAGKKSKIPFAPFLTISLAIAYILK